MTTTAETTCDTCHETEADCYCGVYLVVADTQADDELRARAQAYLDEHEPEGVSVAVCSMADAQRRGVDAEATYRRSADGSWQVLGFSIPVPDRIETLTRDAWNAACAA